MITFQFIQFFQTILGVRNALRTFKDLPEETSLNRMNFIIIGAPGSGKGTQSIKISEKYFLKHVTSGELLREEVKKDTELGKEIKISLETGTLLPDALVQKVLVQNIPKENFILDGYPRKLSQIETFSDIDLVFYIELSEEICVSRILNRGEGRADDNEEIAKKRFQCFNLETRPVIEYYESIGILKTIDESKSADEVFEMIEDAIKEKYK